MPIIKEIGCSVFDVKKILFRVERVFFSPKLVIVHLRFELIDAA